MKPILACLFTLLIVGLLPFSAHAQSDHRLELTMAEGFLSEPVIVRCDGQVVLDKSIATNKSTGIADYVTVKAKTSQPTLQVELPRLNLKSQATIDLNKAAYIEISLNNGRIIWRPTNALIKRD